MLPSESMLQGLPRIEILLARPLRTKLGTSVSSLDNLVRLDWPVTRIPPGTFAYPHDSAASMLQYSASRNLRLRMGTS